MFIARKISTSNRSSLSSAPCGFVLLLLEAPPITPVLPPGIPTTAVPAALSLEGPVAGGSNCYHFVDVAACSQHLRVRPFLLP